MLRLRTCPGTDNSSLPERRKIPSLSESRTPRVDTGGDGVVRRGVHPYVRAAVCSDEALLQLQHTPYSTPAD
ncbi:hypothetical protein J6590_056731 [Homalodisca vitripennis]|nr:hypothetical protein J6590_056731 [Homalodisca vitripennis]